MTSLAIIAPVQFIVDVLKPILVFIHDTLGVGWGVSIVLLTVLVRAAMAPLTVKQFKSMRAMASVAPELKKLQAKYKDDKQRQQQEIMKFYAENKINPFASCLPLLAQFPFFIGLYYLLQSDLRFEICGDAVGVVAGANGKLPPCGQIPNPTGAEQFLFVPDLTAGATGWVLATLMILYVGSQLLSTLLTPSTPDRNQQMLMYGLPLVFAIFILLYSFPAGLLVYWITTNLWTVGQGYLLRKKLGPITPVKLDGDDTAKAGAAKDTIFSKLASGAMGAKSKPAPAPAAAAKPSGPPPRSPRKKKKRSGRRR
ncbi:MAG: YidC/Oxa1 family rane protein insertase [Solirubrobacteraceae bacterium]|jgi:YidC/Oxa1 family membrane protein insertase|nr:YidC/Oxa1 family rane protein insertase [Solirubrobacteraceae bacterium]